MQSHRGFSDCTVRHAKGVSMPHCPTATTTGSLPAARARDVLTSGAPMTAVAATPVCLRNARRSVVPIIMPPSTPMVGRMVSAGLPSVKHQRGLPRKLLVPRATERADRRLAVGVASQCILVEIDAEPRTSGHGNVAVLHRQRRSADRPSHVLEI